MATKQFQNAKLNVTHLDLKDDTSRSVLQSGENISHSLGKIARWYKDIIWTDSKATTEVFGIVKLSDDYKSESTETVPTSKTLNDVVKLIKQTGGWNTTYDFNSNIEGDENLQNGQFKVTEHDLEGDIDHYVSIKGLGSAAYTESSAYATSGHTHKYAGSSSAGGVANSAAKLSDIPTAGIGSETKPVFFSGTTGRPVACTYSLNTTVPANAIFTDEKVKQSPVTTDGSFEVLFAGSTGNTEKTEGVSKTTTLTFNPSTGALSATSFSGNGSGLTSLNASNISSGTLAVNRLPGSAVTVGTYGPAAGGTLSHSGTFDVPDFTVDAKGRITGAHTRTFTLPAQYTHPTHTSKTSGLYKITVDSLGHVSGTAAVTKSDIPALDYVSSTTTRNPNVVLAGPASGTTAAAPTFRALVAADLPSSGATAGSYGPSANATPGYGATFNVPYITVDNKGRVTGIENKTVKIPASDNTNTTYSFATGDTNGTFKVTPSGGTATNIAIKGLGSAAYTNSSAYATAGHIHSYLPLDGGTMTGDITFAGVSSTTYPALSNQIYFSGNTDWARILYEVTASDAGQLVFETGDDANAKIVFRNKVTSGGTYTRQVTIADGVISGNGSGLTSLNASNISSGTLSADRLATSGATAGSYGPSANATPGYGSTFNVPYITVDAKGRVTAISTKTVKIPASDNTNTTYTFATGDNNGTFKVTPSGGTATNISIKGISHVAGDSTGSGIVIGGNGLTVLGSGESASALVTAASLSGANETLYLTSDTTIGFYVNCQTISERKGITLNASLSLYPNNNNVGSIGTSANKWNTMYATTFHGALSGNATSASKWATARTLTLSGSVTGSVSIDGSGNVTLSTTTNHSHNYAGSASAGGPAYSVEGGKGTTEVFRHVWFSTDSVETKRAYSDKFMFEPSSGILKFNSWYPLDITDNTVDLNSYNDGNGKYGYRRYICRSTGGGNKISNKPCDSPFLLEVFLIRFATASTDYITKQVYHAFNKKTYQRFCTNGTWDSWTELKYTDTNTDTKVTQTATTTSAAYEVLFSGTADNTTRTEGARKNSNLTFNPSTGILTTDRLYSARNTGTYLAGNTGSAIINSTASAGAYVMLARMHSTNGYFTHGTYEGKYLLQYTAQSTIDAGTNAVTKSVTLLNESGNSSFPGTVTAATFSGSGASLKSLNASNISSGTLSADRLATSGATAGSYGPSANATPGYGATFNVPYITVDNKGRVTAISTKTVKIPASDNTDTKVTQSATTTTNFRGVILGTNNTVNTGDTRETTVTGQGYITNKIFAQPSTGNLYASNIYAFVNGTDEVRITLYRSGNSSWRFLNSGGTLSLQNNFYSDKVQSWYNVAQFDYGGTNAIKLMTPPQLTGTNRSTTYGYSTIDMGICSKNSWAMSMRWLNNARNAVRGSFGAYGTADNLTYYYWGTEYNATKLRLYPGTGGGLVSQQSNGFRIAANGYGVIFRVDNDNFYILLTDKKTDGSELTGDNWNSKRPLQIGLSSGVCNINGTAATAKKLRHCTLCNEASDAASYPWYRIAYAYTTGTYSDLNLVMMVTCGYGSKWGIFKARARTEGTAGTFGGTVTIEWIVNDGFTNAQLYLLTKNNYQVDTAKSGTATAEIWFKSDGRYWGYTFTVLHEGWRTGTASDLWALLSYSKNGSESYNKNASGVKGVTSSKIYSTNTPGSSSHAGYSIPFFSGPIDSSSPEKNDTATSGNKTVLHNGEFRLGLLEGTTSADGYAQLVLGNGIASGTAGNKYGKISLYSSSTYAVQIIPANLTGTRTLTLPNASGTVALTSHTHSYIPTSSAATLFSGTAAASITMTSMSGYKRLVVFCKNTSNSSYFTVELQCTTGYHYHAMTVSPPPAAQTSNSFYGLLFNLSSNTALSVSAGKYSNLSSSASLANGPTVHITKVIGYKF